MHVYPAAISISCMVHVHDVPYVYKLSPGPAIFQKNGEGKKVLRVKTKNPRASELMWNLNSNLTGLTVMTVQAGTWYISEICFCRKTA